MSPEPTPEHPPDVPAGRSASAVRETRETRVRIALHLDPETPAAEIATGIGFFDHMLETLARHAGISLTVEAEGDLQVDPHHTMEDVGLTLGGCLAEALGDLSGVRRFGSAHVPLDEALSRVVVDLCGRPFLAWRVAFPAARVGEVPTELFEDFFRALTDRGRITVHVDGLVGRNSHHLAETVFKAFARALAEAKEVLGSEVPSTKGTLSR